MDISVAKSGQTWEISLFMASFVLGKAVICKLKGVGNRTVKKYIYIKK